MPPPLPPEPLSPEPAAAAERRPIRLLVVDDSGFMRIALRKMVEGEPDIAVVGEAGDGRSALQLALELRPDVITMDVEMPELDGIEATAAIMAQAPCPIVMLSNYTQAGSTATFRALEAGAVDFISKATSFVRLDIGRIDQELKAKVRYWAAHPPAHPDLPAPPPARVLREAVPAAAPDLVVVGVSTGGPPAVRALLTAAGPLPCPVVVAQHMPALFTAGLAEHLGRETGLRVVEGADGAEAAAGEVTIAPGGLNTTLRRDPAGRLRLRVRDGPETPVRPSADLLFLSAVEAARRPVAVVLTGMGRDGAEGAEALARRGWPVLVQEPASCVVAGMPGATIAAGAASEVLTVEGIGARLRGWFGR